MWIHVQAPHFISIQKDPICRIPQQRFCAPQPPTTNDPTNSQLTPSLSTPACLRRHPSNDSPCVSLALRKMVCFASTPKRRSLRQGNGIRDAERGSRDEFFEREPKEWGGESSRFFFFKKQMRKSWGKNMRKKTSGSYDINHSVVVSKIF